MHVDTLCIHLYVNFTLYFHGKDVRINTFVGRNSVQEIHTLKEAITTRVTISLNRITMWLSSTWLVQWYLTNIRNALSRSSLSNTARCVILKEGTIILTNTGLCPSTYLKASDVFWSLESMSVQKGESSVLERSYPETWYKQEVQTYPSPPVKLVSPSNYIIKQVDKDARWANKSYG